MSNNIVKESSRGYELVPVESELLTKREVFMCGEVSAESCNDIIKQLLVLEREDNTKEIKLYINSPGGEVTSGLALYDTIRLLKSPIKTICVGSAASMGAVLFLAADDRKMLRHSKIMIHDPSYGRMDVGGMKPHEIESEINDLKKCREVLAKIIAERTGKPLRTVLKVTAKDSFFDAKEAIEFGLATGIVESLD